jgi:hypothetical protein
MKIKKNKNHHIKNKKLIHTKIISLKQRKKNHKNLK